MPYSLQSRKVLITGGSRGLGALIAEKFAAEGCHVAINYLEAKCRAEETATKCEKLGVKAVVVQGDMGLQKECQRVVQSSIKALDGLDIIIHNAGWTKFAAFSDLDSLSEEDWDRCWAVNTKANLHLVREALPTFNANPEGGVYIMTSSIAGISTSGSSMAYSVSKAAGLHLMKCLAEHQGSKLRINAVLPGLLMTEWGMKFPSERIEQIREKSVLKKDTDLDDCADAFVAIAKNSSMTGQNMQIDSGLVIGTGWRA